MIHTKIEFDGERCATCRKSLPIGKSVLVHPTNGSVYCNQECAEHCRVIGAGYRQTWDRICIECKKLFVTSSCAMQTCHDCKVAGFQNQIKRVKRIKEEALALKWNNEQRKKGG